MSNTKLRRRAMLGGGGPIEVVDFGLSVKWLKYNLAGDKLTDNECDYGYYYQWGSTIGYPDASTHTFDNSNCPYYDASSKSFTKYNSISGSGTIDNKTTLEPMDDAVTALLGSNYRMPTKDEFVELYNHCTGTSGEAANFNFNIVSGTTSVSSKGLYFVASETTVDGIKYKNAGCLFVGQDITKRIFLPMCGRCNKSSLENMDTYGAYWTSSALDNVSYQEYYKKYGYVGYQYNMEFSKSSTYIPYFRGRSYGYNVRGVKIA